MNGIMSVRNFWRTAQLTEVPQLPQTVGNPRFRRLAHSFITPTPSTLSSRDGSGKA
jgi:hypothetical protein